VERTAPDFFDALEAFVRHGVDFIVVGGVSAVLHGAPLATFDLDIVHSRSARNLERLVFALGELEAYYRGRGEQHLRPQSSDFSSPGHHLLMTRAGAVDVLGAIGTDSGYEELLPHSIDVNVEGLRVRVLGLEMLIRLKEETGHLKDKAVLPVLLQTLREKKGKPD
jgi:hypothetical protein